MTSKIIPSATNNTTGEAHIPMMITLGAVGVLVVFLLVISRMFLCGRLAQGRNPAADVNRVEQARLLRMNLYWSFTEFGRRILRKVTYSSSTERSVSGEGIAPLLLEPNSDTPGPFYERVLSCLKRSTVSSRNDHS